MFPLPGFESGRGLLALCLLLFACQQGLAATGIKAKAWLAPVLIKHAWERSVANGGGPVKPWPWADTWPVARLSVPSKGVDLLVLDGATGNALAFGPGLASYSSQPGDPGLVVIAGHRDTHFNFLRELRAGDVLYLETEDGTEYVYATHEVRVVDSTDEVISLEDQASSLLLVTCYPFDSLRAGGPLRYTVRAERWSL